jgi:SAM-dependent methyltransferase
VKPWEAHNRKAWDERARSGKRHTKTVLEKDLADPLPIVDPENWFGSVAGRRVLCLAAGGGLQSALLAAAKAQVTVVDISAEMLELDRIIAARHGFQMRILQASMDNLEALGDDTFDLVLQPVSTCYIPDIRKVYGEVARVLVRDGLYISQHKQPINLQSSYLHSPQGYTILHSYFTREPLPPLPESTEHREADNFEFIHSWQDLIGGMCAAGFSVEGLVEPRHCQTNASPGTFGDRSCFVPPYAKIKARLTKKETASVLWTPS